MILGGGWPGCHSCPIRPGTPVMFTSISWSSHNNFFKVSLFTFIFSSPLPQLSILVEFLMKALTTWWHWGVCWSRRGLGATHDTNWVTVVLPFWASVLSCLGGKWLLGSWSQTAPCTINFQIYSLVDDSHFTDCLGSDDSESQNR